MNDIRASFNVDPHDLYPVIVLRARDIEALDAWLERTGFAHFEAWRSPPVYENPNHGMYSKWWIELKFTEENGGYKGSVGWPSSRNNVRAGKEYRLAWMALVDIMRDR